MSLDEYDKRTEAQSGKCAICLRPNSTVPALYVDHKHGEDGFVRDLICHPCNASLGFMNDDPRLIRALANYVEWHDEHLGQKPFVTPLKSVSVGEAEPSL